MHATQHEHSTQQSLVVDDVTANIQKHIWILQVNLEWLDLSFNSISKLEGLEKLVKLTDLSLFSNKLDKIENIQKLTELVVLSLGKSSRHTAAVQISKLNCNNTM